jgi:hypothetical protein
MVLVGGVILMAIAVGVALSWERIRQWLSE